MTKEHLFKGLALAGIAAYLASCTFYEADGPSIIAEQQRQKAPQFTLTDVHGQAVKLSDYKGKVLLLNFWATWCGPCRVEIPWFVKFQNEYKDRDFAVLGISADEDGWKAVQPFVAQRKINYPVVLENAEVDRLYGGIEALPTTFIIDREGRVAASHSGLVTMGTYRQEILSLLGDSNHATKSAVSLNRLPAYVGRGLLQPAWLGASN